jgi:peptidoglycan hydrolase-like protein with peptidoglycan-binding domain
MFKNILNEIHRQKKLMNLIKEDKDIKSVIFGDNIIDYLNKNNFEEIPQLTGKFLKLKDLISNLKNIDVKPEVDHVFFSIGKNDKFENEDLIDILSHRLKMKFPNARINVINPILDDNDYSNLSNEIAPNENKIFKFYNEFKNNEIDIVGEYTILDTSRKDNKIKSLENDILNKMVTDFSKEGLDYEEDMQQNIKNVDIFGEDETDFDTIYEFINRFEDITKSKNEYKKDMPSSFKPDIEQIQIVLKFLDKENTNLEVTGEIDDSTIEAIEDYQRQNNLEVTGIADNETLDELLYDLKAKGFDELDLSKYMEDIGVDTNVRTSNIIINDPSNLKKLTKKGLSVGALGVGAGVVGGVILNMPNDNTEVSYNKLLSDLKTLGLTDSAAKGLVANAYGESGLNSKAKGDSGSYASNNKNSINIDGKRYCSFGLWQYNICGGMGNSYLQKHGVDPSSPDSQKKIDILFDYKKQVEFMSDRIRKEQQRGDKGVGEWIDWIVDNVERPSDKSGAKSKRRSYASARGWL